MEIQDILNEFIARGLGNEKIYSLVGTAVNVDKTKRVCDFDPLSDDARRYDVRLQSVISETKGVVFVPKENSKVIVTFLNKSKGFVSLTSELECIHFEAGGEDLKIIINDLISEIKNMIIQTPAGPGTVSQGTKTLLDQIDSRVNMLLC